MRVAVVALWIQLAIWTLKLPRILDIIESKPRKPDIMNSTEEMVGIITRISNWKLFVIRRNCLKKNLLYYYFLVTTGVTQLTLHVGVRKPDEGIDGHCWLTLRGEVYQDSENNISKYTVMYARGV